MCRNKELNYTLQYPGSTMTGVFKETNRWPDVSIIITVNEVNWISYTKLNSIDEQEKITPFEHVISIVKSSYVAKDIGIWSREITATKLQMNLK